MSHEATNWAFKQKGLKPATKIVLLALADRHNPDYGCFPSKKQLANDCEMSERAVYSHIKALEDAGLIIVDEATEKARGQYASNRYILGFEAYFVSRQNQPSAKSAVGKNEHSPSAKSADDRRQNLPTNPVIEPCKRTSKGSPLYSPKPEKPDKSRIPDGWVPSDEGWEYARSLQIPDEAIRDEARGFQAYWADRTDRDARKSERGWEQCWQSWCRRIASRYQQSRGMAGKAGTGGHRQGGSIASIVARRWADGEV